MRLLICALLMLAAPARAEIVEPGSRYSAIADKLIAYERSTWKLYQAGDKAGLAVLASEDFRDIYPDGDIVTKDEYLADVGAVKVRAYSLSDFHVFMLTPASAIVTYVAHGEGFTPRAGEIRSEVAVTSAWALRKGKWLNIFYRENVLELNGNRLVPARSAQAAAQPRPR